MTNVANLVYELQRLSKKNVKYEERRDAEQISGMESE